MLNETLNEIQRTAGKKDQRLQMEQAQERRQRRQRRQDRSARRYVDGWSIRMF
ncbi:MAG TPA: hypothetical protein VKN35_02010 [Xanthomonadales bacterium]|nr:hypothetical protein [Xanthomonadales bacterium]